MWDAEERPPARKAPVPHLILSRSSLAPRLGHFYSEHINSRNQVNTMKTNAERVFYLEHLNTLRNVSSQNPPGNFSRFTFPVSVSVDFSSSVISNRQ